MRALGLFIPLIAIWLLWSGYFTAFLIGLGLMSVVITLLICMRLKLVDEEGSPSHVMLRAIPYTAWLLKEIVVAGLDVTRRVFGPRSGISPTLIEVKCTQKTDLCRVIFANSITLTPGTVSYGVQEDKILVHAISKEVAQGCLDSDMDARVTWVEGQS